MNTLFPVILSGGSGTRLWPLSRAMYPKQFVRFSDQQDKTFLGATLARLRPDDGFNAPIILCNNDHRFLVREELEQADLAAHAIILEPVARNTAPAIAVAALVALRENPNAILIVMPSDHVVRDEAAFIAHVKQAADVAATGKLVLFGIKPSEPHTGYGYIRQGAALAGTDGTAFKVDAFFEKPDLATAESYVAANTYFWNSGIFVLNARVLIEELKRVEPKIVTAASDAIAGAEQDLGFTRLAKAAFEKAPNISIDYAVMEKTTNAAMLPIDVGWNDVGSWTSLWDIAKRDADGNFVQGQAVLTDTSSSYIHASKSLVATIGVDNLIIVDTPDALLVADKSRAQDVSKLVALLRATGRKEHEQHLRNLRNAKPREPVSGEAVAREARRQTVDANAPPPLRALDCCARHSPCGHRRQGAVGEGRRKRIYLRHPMAPLREPRQSTPRNHRGAAWHISGRRRHPAHRRHLQSLSRRN
jgi:mannose-1-phosphate guanylyltransferase / mannose-6-phosphate isomerase